MPGGGLMQLVAYGAQDVYLRGSPNITFWKTTYRRNTNFTIKEMVRPYYYSDRRTYVNFELLFDDTKNKELYYNNDSIVLCSIDLNDLNNNIILINSEKNIKENKDKLNKIIKPSNIYDCDERDTECYTHTYKIKKPKNILEKLQQVARSKQINNQMKNQLKSQIKSQMRRR